MLHEETVFVQLNFFFPFFISIEYINAITDSCRCWNQSISFSCQRCFIIILLLVEEEKSALPKFRSTFNALSNPRKNEAVRFGKLRCRSISARSLMSATSQTRRCNFPLSIERRQRPHRTRKTIAAAGAPTIAVDGSFSALRHYYLFTETVEAFWARAQMQTRRNPHAQRQSETCEWNLSGREGTIEILQKEEGSGLLTN